MKTSASSLQSFYLRWAGLVSAGLGLLAFFLLILAFREDVPGTKLVLAIAGLIGTFISYAIGKDIMGRIRNQDESGAKLSNHQARLALLEQDSASR